MYNNFIFILFIVKTSFIDVSAYENRFCERLSA